MAGLDGRKISPHRDSIPGPSSPQSVAIPTELPGPQSRINTVHEFITERHCPIFPYKCISTKFQNRCFKSCLRYTSGDLYDIWGYKYYQKVRKNLKFVFRILSVSVRPITAGKMKETVFFSLTARSLTVEARIISICLPNYTTSYPIIPYHEI